MVNTTLNPILQTAIADVYDRLHSFGEDPLFTMNLVSIFGQNAVKIQPNQFLAIVNSLPALEIQTASNLQRALGAFSSQTNTIYLSDSLLSSNQSNQLTAVLLEEIGHYLDSRLNKVDTKGDEGELFSAIVRGLNLSTESLTRIKNEMDQRQLILNGKLITVEQATVAPAVTEQKLLFWNRFETKSDVLKSEIGPDVYLRSYLINNWDQAQITSAKFGNGLYVNHPITNGWNTVGANFFATSLPDMGLTPNRGTIELWFTFKYDSSTFSTAYFFLNAASLTGHFPGTSYGQNLFANTVISAGWNGWDYGGGVGKRFFFGLDDVTDSQSGAVTFLATPSFSAGPGGIYDFTVDTTRHFAFVWDAGGIASSTDTMRIYVDGQQAAAMTVSLPIAKPFDPYLYIGTIPNSGPQTATFYDALKGVTDNMKIWNYAKTDFSDRFVEGINEPSQTFTTTLQTDNFAGRSGDDIFNSTWANLQQGDVLNGQLGRDLLVITAGTNATTITIDAGNSTNQIRNIPGTIVYNFERFDLSGFLGMTNFTGSTGNDWVKGGAVNDYLGGGDGNDYLNGGAGIDTMGGGLGDDTYVIDNLADAVIEFFNNGVDTIESPFTWTLATNLENLVLTGTSHLNGTGNELDNTLSGNSGNNILDGLTGGDRLMGGLGNDTYIVDNIRDVVTENANEGQDLVQATVNTTLTNNVEDLTLLGTANINGTGNNANNILTGNSGANLLKGLNGNDTLSGGAGNDTLIGGLGNDRLVGEAGADQFLFGSSSAFKTSNLGVDTITDFTKNSDKIALSKVTFNALTSPVGTLQTAEFVQINSSLSNELSLVGSSSEKVVYNQTTGNLFYNPDGAIAGLTNGGQFSTLSNKPSLSATDFLVQS